MTDLEDVLTNLDKFKKSIKEQIKFIEKLEKLFGTWDAHADMGTELTSTSFNDLFDEINKVLIG